MRGGTHAESGINDSRIAHAPAHRKQRDHPEWWQRDMRQEKGGNQYIRAKAKRHDIPARQRTCAAMTGNKNKARPDAYGEENSNPAAAGIYWWAHEDRPKYKPILVRETHPGFVPLTRFMGSSYIAFLMFSRAVLMT